MKAYWKDIFRTIKYGKKRFFCLMLITALGVTMFTGIRAACDDLIYTADAYYDELQLYDISIASTMGLTEKDVEALADLEGVETAEGGYEVTAYTEYDHSTYETKIRMIGETLNQPYLVQGTLPMAPDEIAVNSRYMKDSGKQIGDVIPLYEVPEEDQDPFLASTAFTITGVIDDPMDVNQSDGNMSWRSTAAVDYVFYLDASGFDAEIYTYVYLLAEGAKELQTHSERYEARIADLEDQIYEKIRPLREQERREEIVAEAYEAYTEAESEVLAELEEARLDLEQGRADLEEGKRELAKFKKQLESGKRELEDGEKQLEAGKKQLTESEQYLNVQMENAWKEIQVGMAQIDSAKTVLAAKEQEVSEGKLQLEQAKNQLTQKETEALGSINQAIAALEQQLEIASEEEKEQIQAQIAGLLQQKTQVEASFAPGWEQLRIQEETLLSGEAQILTAKGELQTQEAALQEGSRTLEAKEREGRVQIAAAKVEIAENEQQLNAAKKELADGEAQLHSGEQDLAEGEAELADGESEFLEGKQEAEAELAEAKAEIAEIEMPEWYIQTRSSLSGYANVDSDAASIKGIGTFLAVIFFVVAILVSLTTITRMVEEDRGLIGTYKALGFTNREIRRKAVLFAASACVAGGILGDIGGYVILPKIIIIIFHTMYTFPQYLLRFDWLFGLLGIGLFVLGVVCAAIWSCSAILKQMPAILMRPQTPRSGSRIFLEKLPFIWKRLSFLNKVTARNLFRYKKRLCMTVFGIMGCTALLVCGFGIKNTVTDFMPKQYEHTYEYDMLAAVLPEDNEQLLSYVKDPEYIEAYLNMQIESVKIKNARGREETVQMVVIPTGEDLDPFIHLRLKDDSIIPLAEDGIIVTRNVSEILEFSAGDAVLIRDLALNEQEVQVSEIVENYLGNMIYVSQSYYEENFKPMEANGVFINLFDSCQDPMGYAVEFGKQDGVVSCVSTDSLREDFSSAFALMNMVVYVVIVLAAGLAFVVLFTLATTNISERSRELATIKVLGFYDREVHLYVNKETLILSLFGIAAGLPLGVFLTWGLSVILKLPGIYFDISIFPSTYVFAAVISFGFSVIVNQITNKLLDVIDPVEALKSVE